MQQHHLEQRGRYINTRLTSTLMIFQIFPAPAPAAVATGLFAGCSKLVWRQTVILQFGHAISLVSHIPFLSIVTILTIDEQKISR
jgi:hypothetical protein